MPATFTKILADHITQQTGVEATEGEDGMVVEAGKVYVAPGGFHMLLVKDGVQLKLKIDDGPQENYCKPAVDPMFRSAIDIFGNKVLGVILTGMGSDGLKGSQMLVEKGGRLIAQDEESSVVWGMPGAVAMAGVCSEVLPLDDIGPWVKRAVLG
jgi:two-component system chemotaxis response regulator CheB